jgi:hypothetical protein
VALEVPANQRDMDTLLFGTLARRNISETASLL